MTRPELDAMRYAEAEWKAGYRAATAHQQWTVVAGVLAAVVVLRRWRIPMVAIVVWLVVAAVALWPVTITLGVLEVRRRRRIRRALAATHRDDPFPDDDGGEALPAPEYGA